MICLGNEDQSTAECQVWHFSVTVTQTTGDGVEAVQAEEGPSEDRRRWPFTHHYCWQAVAAHYEKMVLITANSDTPSKVSSVVPPLSLSLSG